MCENTSHRYTSIRHFYQKILINFTFGIHKMISIHVWREWNNKSIMKQIKHKHNKKHFCNEYRQIPFIADSVYNLQYIKKNKDYIFIIVV